MSIAFIQDLLVSVQGSVEAGSSKTVLVSFNPPKDVPCSLVAANTVVSCPLVVIIDDSYYEFISLVDFERTH